MARPAKPWYRKGRGWYVEIAGHQCLLSKGGDDAGGRAEAHRAWHQALAAGGRLENHAEIIATRTLIQLFLGRCERELEDVTARGYFAYLADFDDRHGLMPAETIKPLHVQQWLDSHGWGPTTRRNATVVLKRMFNWSRKSGHIRFNPIRDIELPPALVRSHVLSAEQAKRIFAAIKCPAFRDLVRALWETGARPGEIIGLTAAQVEGTRWRVPNKTWRKTGESHRLIELTPAMAALSRELADRHPTGPIFRNAWDRPWNLNRVGERFDRLRKKLGYGPEVCAYAYRHRYITDALLAGVPVATVSEMVGHRDTKMVMRVYSHLHEHRDHLRDAVAKVRPAEVPEPAEAPTAPPAKPAPVASAGSLARWRKPRSARPRPKRARPKRAGV